MSNFGFNFLCFRNFVNVNKPITRLKMYLKREIRMNIDKSVTITSRILFKQLTTISSMYIQCIGTRKSPKFITVGLRLSSSFLRITHVYL